MARIVTVSGISGVGFLVVGVAIPLLLPEQLPDLARYALLGLGALLLGTAWLWWALNKSRTGEGGGATQSTQGSHSPAIAAGRDIHYYQPPPATPHEGGIPWPKSTGRNIGERMLREERQRCPEMPIWKAIVRVATSIGDDDNEFPEARRQIRQAAVEGRLDVWGKKDIPPQHFKDERHSSVWTRIDPEHWHNYELNPLATAETTDGRDHTWDENVRDRRGSRYWSLRVRQREVDRLWPTREPSDELKVSGAIEPDLPLAGLLVRVYKKLGPVPNDAAERGHFFERVDRYIADAVAIHKLHLWGRPFKRPIAKITEHQWAMGTFDHRANTLKVPSDAAPMVYTDLHFSKAEVERHWPRGEDDP